MKSPRKSPEHPILDLKEMLGDEYLYTSSLRVDANRYLAWVVAYNYDRNDEVSLRHTQKLLRIDIANRRCDVMNLDERIRDDIWVDETGNLYIYEIEKQQIVMLDPLLNRQRMYPVGDILRMSASSKGNVFVTSFVSNHIKLSCYDMATQLLWEQIAPPGVFDVYPFVYQDSYSSVMVAQIVYAITYTSEGSIQSVNPIARNHHSLENGFRSITWSHSIANCSLSSDGQSIVVRHGHPNRGKLYALRFGLPIGSCLSVYKFGQGTTTYNELELFPHFLNFQLVHRINQNELIVIEDNRSKGISRLHLMNLSELGRGRRYTIDDRPWASKIQ